MLVGKQKKATAENWYSFNGTLYSNNEHNECVRVNTEHCGGEISNKKIAFGFFFYENKTEIKKW